MLSTVCVVFLSYYKFLAQQNLNSRTKKHGRKWHVLLTFLHLHSFLWAVPFLCSFFPWRHTTQHSFITLTKLKEENGMQAQESILVEKNSDISKASSFKSLAPTFQVLDSLV